MLNKTVDIDSYKLEYKIILLFTEAAIACSIFSSIVIIVLTVWAVRG